MQFVRRVGAESAISEISASQSVEFPNEERRGDEKAAARPHPHCSALAP
jgi:hypothetical protein